jgi:hypothetical protein
MDLAGVNTATHQNTERRGRLRDSRGTTNCARRTIEPSEKAIAEVFDSDSVKSLDLIAYCIVVPMEWDAPMSILHLWRLLRRVDDIGDEDREK